MDVDNTGKLSEGISENLQVEAGMAYALERPILVFASDGTDVGSFLRVATHTIILKENYESDLKNKHELIQEYFKNTLKIIQQKWQKEEDPRYNEELNIQNVEEFVSKVIRYIRNIQQRVNSVSYLQERKVMNGLVFPFIDMIQKNGSTRQYETCRAGLEALGRVMAAYFECVKYVTTDDEFLLTTYKHLENITLMALSSKDIILLGYLFKTLGDIASESSRRIHIYIPYSSIATKYIGSIALKAATEELWEPCSDAISSMQKIAVNSMECCFDYNDSDSEQIKKIAIRVFGKESDIAQLAALRLGYLLMISVRLQRDVSKQIRIIENLSTEVIKSTQLFHADKITLLNSFYSPYRSDTWTFLQILILLIGLKNTKHPQNPQLEYHQEKYVAPIIDEIIHVLVRLAEVSIEHEEIFLSSIADSLLEIGLKCVKETFAYVNDFMNNMYPVVNHLVTWYVLSKYPRPEIPEKLTVIAFEAIVHNYSELASFIIDKLYDFVTKRDSEQNNMKGVRRTLDRIQMIGIIALQNNNEGVANQAIRYLKLNDYNSIDEQLRMFTSYKPPWVDITFAESWFYTKLTEKSLPRFKDLFFGTGKCVDR